MLEYLMLEYLNQTLKGRQTITMTSSKYSLTRLQLRFAGDLTLLCVGLSSFGRLIGWHVWEGRSLVTGGDLRWIAGVLVWSTCILSGRWEELSGIS
jgi:hypothetical protein